MRELAVGDLVEAIPPHALASGSGIYAVAVVVSLAPFALVSEDGDMMWTKTHNPTTVRPVGIPFDPGPAFARWQRDRDAADGGADADSFKLNPGGHRA